MGGWPTRSLMARKRAETKGADPPQLHHSASPFEKFISVGLRRNFKEAECSYEAAPKFKYLNGVVEHYNYSLSVVGIRFSQIHLSANRKPKTENRKPNTELSYASAVIFTR
jgi:hypothetical protein